jgi:glycosyltransferase involved in cell wall biosynthesis
MEPHKTNEFIHITNKPGVGGIESLVNYLTKKKSLEFQNHNSFYLAKNQLEYIFLRNFVLREFLYIYKAVYLLKFTKMSNRQIVLFFHHPECHKFLVTFNSLNKIFLNIKTINVIYLHQSYSNLPKKMIKFTRHGLNVSHGVICYSKKVLADWENSLTLMPKNRFVLRNFVAPRRFSNKRNLNTKFFTLLYVGRNASWKQPELVLQFAKQIYKDTKIPIKVYFIGKGIKERIINMTSSLQEESNPEFVLKYLPSVKNPIGFYTRSDLLVYPVDSSKSKESIGISALEALCSKMSVVVKNKSHTDYKISGIISMREFRTLAKKSSIESLRKNLEGDSYHHKLWLHECSPIKYVNQLNDISNKLAFYCQTDLKK